MRIALCTSLLSAVLFAPHGASQNLLANPSFETGLTGWTSFGNAFAEFINPPAIDPRTGVQVGKLYGDFSSGGFTVSGLFQSFPASPGQTFTLDCWSRHWDGDPLTGAGAPNDNWVVMKIAFWNALNLEIGGAERTILDGLSARNVWIDNAAVAGTAPVGTVRVEALILFLHPGVAPGSALVDDVEFLGPPAAGAYPGTGEDLVLSSAVNGGLLSSGPGNDIKPISAGDFLELNVSSPGSGFALQPYVVFAQLYPTGFPSTPNPIFPGLWFNFVSLPVITLQNGQGTPIGPPRIGPGRGTSEFYRMPATFTGSGLSLMVQALVVLPSTANGFYAASDGHEIRFQ